jgi:hypothetical protein
MALKSRTRDHIATNEIAGSILQDFKTAQPILMSSFSGTATSSATDRAKG